MMDINDPVCKCLKSIIAHATSVRRVGCICNEYESSKD